MAKKNKIDVSQSGSGPALKHNPFAALGGVAASPAVAIPASSAENANATQPDPTAKPRGRLVLRREKKHRGGKTVVVVAGFETRPKFGASDIAELAQHLKQQLGCGGAVERADSRSSESEIVLQGDQPARVAELLRARGFRVDGVTS
jgi:translation initiation factor 1